MSSLDHSPGDRGGDRPSVQRINRVPVFVFIGLVIVFITVIVWGLSVRGLYRRGNGGIGTATGSSASNFADKLKQGVSNGVIEPPHDTAPIQIAKVPAPVAKTPAPDNPFKPSPGIGDQARNTSPLEPEAQWRERLRREEKEQLMRLRHQQQMARVQANNAAYDSPITVSLGKLGQVGARARSPSVARNQRSITELYAAALRAGPDGLQKDPNGQSAKAAFLNQQITDGGYLSHAVVPQQSPYELKR